VGLVVTVVGTWTVLWTSIGVVVVDREVGVCSVSAGMG